MGNLPGDSRLGHIQKKITHLLVYFLFNLHGLPVLTTKQSSCWRVFFRVLRLSSITFVNLYVGYRLYKLMNQKNFTYDTFPLINATVSASVVDSVAIYSHKFSKFSTRLFGLLNKRSMHLSTGAICRLVAYYCLFVSYVLVCTTIFPIHANHWFDSGKRNDTPPDFLHTKSVRPCTHIVIFVMSSGNVVSHLMLFCFVCCLLQRILISLLDDLKSRSKLESLQEFRFRFIEVANLVRCADNVFSFFGLVGLGCVLSRACSCIHFYLNMKAPFKDSWIFILVQIAFDFCALTALSCFAASVSEEGRKIAPEVFRASQLVSTRKTDFHIQCLAVSKVVMSSDIHLSAWKLFPFSRGVLPTVIGVTISYVAVIIQMHHAASFELIYFVRAIHSQTDNSTSN